MAKNPDLEGKFGNRLGKAKRTYSITEDCEEMMSDLGVNFGLNQGSVIEMAVRMWWTEAFGPRLSARNPGGAMPGHLADKNGSRHTPSFR